MIQHSPPIVLAVDDNVTNLRVLHGALADTYSVRVALDGETAVRLAEQTRPDIILMDIMMPGMDGLETCRLLKQNPHTARIPVVFVTARDDPETETRGLKLGAIDYIQKPFSPEVVKARVANHLELSRLRESLESVVSERTVELVRARDSIIVAMAILAEHRDESTGAHTERAKQYVRLLATRISELRPDLLPPERVDLVARSSVLHDIGKVAIPDTILRKPGLLTPQEFEIIKTHTTEGGKIIRQVETSLGTNEFFQFAREIAESHHERWDGTGYPRGLAGESIPISASMMAIADVYDALTSDRPYKKAYSHERARSILLEGNERTRTGHFIPLVLACFAEVEDEFRSIHLQLPY